MSAPTDLLSLAAFASDQLLLPEITVEFNFLFVPTGFGPIVEILDFETADTGMSPMPRTSRTSQIMAEMRAADAAHAARNAEKAAALAEERSEMTARQKRANPLRPTLPRIHPSKLDAGQQAATQVLLRGTEDILDRNAMKRDHSLPRRALSMAASRGRVTPDMLASVLAYFQNPSDMAHAMLLSFLPTKVALADAKALIAERAEAEGWGTEATSALLPDLPSILKSLNPNTGRNGRAPGRVVVADGVTPATVPTGKRGRPSGPKYVDYLVPTADVCEAAGLLLAGHRPILGPPATFGIPGGNDVAQGPLADRRRA